VPSFDHFALIASLYARVTYSKTDVMREVAALPARGCLLDAGGGTGRVASAIRGLVDDVVLADVSFGMLKEALDLRSNLSAVILNPCPSPTIPSNASSWWMRFITSLTMPTRHGKCSAC
jgi:hypothetical protein